MNPKKICILGLNAYLNAASDKLYQKITQKYNYYYFCLHSMITPLLGDP